MYWEIRQALTHNCLFNFIVGNRGAGKTFSSTDFAIQNFVKNGKEFMYVRRYDTELKDRNKFFDAIRYKYPELDLEIKGYNALINGKVAGHFMALSKAKIKKSTSYPNVNLIIFDEFILDKGNYHYIADEVTNFLELYETVARTRDDVRAFFLSNAITVTNPYFLYFDINVDGTKRFYKPNKDILVEFVQNKEYIEMKEKTRFGQLIKGTKYGDYAINNKMLRDSNTFIAKKSGKSRHYFTMIYKGENYAVWIDWGEGKYFVSSDIDPTCGMIYSITQSDHSPNTMLLKGRKSRILTEFIQNYQLGNVYYESMNIKNIVFEIVRLSLI